MPIGQNRAFAVLQQCGWDDAGVEMGPYRSPPEVRTCLRLDTGKQGDVPDCQAFRDRIHPEGPRHARVEAAARGLSGRMKRNFEVDLELSPRRFDKPPTFRRATLLSAGAGDVVDLVRTPGSHEQ